MTQLSLPLDSFNQDIIAMDKNVPERAPATDSTEPSDHLPLSTPHKVSRPRGWTGKAFEAMVLDLPCKPQTIAEAVDLIAKTNYLTASQLRHIQSDARKALVMVQRSGNEMLRSLPCDPVELRPLLRSVLPARHRVDMRRWSSVKSSIHRALKLSGWIATDAEVRSPPSIEWQAAVALVEPPPQRAVVSIFAGYCTRERIALAGVSAATIEAYREWRTRRTLDLTVSVTISQLRCILNRTGKRLPSWPVPPVEPLVDRRRMVLPDDMLPAAFLADLNAYVTRLSNPDPFDPVFNKRVAARSLKDIIGSLKRGASVLIRAGVPVASIRDVVMPDHMKQILLEGYQRLGGGQQWPSRMRAVADWLKKAAHQWGNFSAEELARIDEYRKLIGNSSPRMSDKSRNRVAQFDEDPQLLADFFALPAQTFAAADHLYKEGRKKQAARLHRTALSLALLQAKPMRRENLSNLEHERHFVRRGRYRYGQVFIPAGETKGGVAVRAELPPVLCERIALHMTKYRPLMECPEGPFLFSWSATEPLDPATLAHHLTRLVERQVGVRFSPHLARHLAATILLDEDPANLPVAQALLGHADPKTTGRFYGAQTTRSAQAHWNRILEAKVKHAKRRPRGRPTKGGR